MSNSKPRKRMKNYIITDFFTNYEDITETSTQSVSRDRVELGDRKVNI